jgi:hypothetical protein
VNAQGARRLARIAREAGVERFIHVSHLNAQPNPPSIYVKGGSKYLISKVGFSICYYMDLLLFSCFYTVVVCCEVVGLRIQIFI